MARRGGRDNEKKRSALIALTQYMKQMAAFSKRNSNEQAIDTKATQTPSPASQEQSNSFKGQYSRDIYVARDATAMNEGKLTRESHVAIAQMPKEEIAKVAEVRQGLHDAFQKRLGTREISDKPNEQEQQRNRERDFGPDR